MNRPTLICAALALSLLVTGCGPSKETQARDAVYVAAVQASSILRRQLAEPDAKIEVSAELFREALDRAAKFYPPESATMRELAEVAAAFDRVSKSPPSVAHYELRLRVEALETQFAPR